MREREVEDDRQYAWIAYAVAILVVGGLTGYVVALQGQRLSASGTATPAPVATTGTVGTAPIADENVLRAYRNILARDPKNVQAAVSAGNLLYDAGRYIEAVPFYRSSSVRPKADATVAGVASGFSRTFSLGGPSQRSVTRPV